jgi:hypothetical protein
MSEHWTSTRRRRLRSRHSSEQSDFPALYGSLLAVLVPLFVFFVIMGLVLLLLTLSTTDVHKGPGASIFLKSGALLPTAAAS